MRRFFSALSTATLALTLLLAPAPAARASESFPDLIGIPDGWLPEGVATGRGPVIYSGSRRTGSIYAADLRTGEGRVLVNQTGRIAVGLSFDQRSNAIFAAGGTNGNAFVYDAATGAELAAFQFTTSGPTFINDVIVTRTAAYFTNSQRAEIYRVALGPGGRLPTDGSFTTIPLSGDWQQVNGFNANGIEATPNGKTLIIVQSATGKLFNVDPATGAADEIDLGGANANNGDGLLLEGKTLYVVQNQQNKIAAFELSGNLRSATLVGEITDGDFDIPTTVARFGDALYAVNARFSSGQSPDLEYDIVRVER
jgi:sugar lactone lactonase YvrE